MLAGPGWGMTGSAICYTLFDGVTPDTDCTPPSGYNCSVQLPIDSVGNMTDGTGQLCKAIASAPATALAPAAVSG